MMYINWATVRLRMPEYRNKYAYANPLLKKGRELLENLKKSNKSLSELENGLIEERMQQIKKLYSMIDKENDEILELKSLLGQLNVIGKQKHTELVNLINKVNLLRLKEGKPQIPFPPEFQPEIVDLPQEETGGFMNSIFGEELPKEVQPKETKGFFSKIFSW